MASEVRRAEESCLSGGPVLGERARLWGILLSPWTVAALALFARLAFGAIYWGEQIWLTDQAFADAQGGDPSKYAVIIRNILEGNGFAFYGRPSARAGPLMPYVMAAVFWLFGTNFWSLLGANALFGAATTWATWKMANALYGDRRVAAIAGVFVALNPGLLHWSAMLVTESLCIALLAWGILYAVEFVQTGRSVRMAVAGGLLGLAALTRPEILATALLLPVAVWVWARGDRGRRSGRAALMFVVALLVTLAPWTIRNYVRFGVVLPITVSGGVALFHGNGPQYEGVGIFDPQVWRPPPKERLKALNRYDLVPGFGVSFNQYDGESDIEERGKALRWALAYIRERPAQYLKRCLGRLITLWLPWTPVMSPLHRAAKALLWLALVPLGAWGLWRSRHASAAIPVMVPILGTTLILTAILLDPALAYRTPAEPFLGVFAAWGWVALWSRLRQGGMGIVGGRGDG